MKSYLKKWKLTEIVVAKGQQTNRVEACQQLFEQINEDGAAKQNL